MVSGPLRSFGSSIYIGAREEARDLALFRCHGQWSFEVIWFLHLHRCEGRSTGSSLGLSQSLLVDVGTLLGSGKVTLDLAVLGKVEGGDLLSLLNLLLVGLDLALQPVNQPLHALVVLPVLLLGVGQLLDLPLGLAQVLQAVSVAPVLSVQLGLQLADA